MTTHIQALILSKNYFSRRQAESYIRRHKQYKPLKMDENQRHGGFVYVSQIKRAMNIGLTTYRRC